MTRLLDVNVLLALLDADHVFHEPAHAWFDAHAAAGWATCPITQNGVIRILGHPRYPLGPGSPGGAATLLASLVGEAHHVFWSDDIGLLSANHVRVEAIAKSAQVTDIYLLALAVQRQGTLATFDRRMPVDAVDGGARALELIE